MFFTFNGTRKCYFENCYFFEFTCTSDPLLVLNVFAAIFHVPALNFVFLILSIKL